MRAKRPIASLLVGALMAGLLAVAAAGPAAAASSCGTGTKTQEYGVNIPLVGWKKVVTHKATSRACEDDRNITSISYTVHSCSKTALAFANSTNKSRTIGRAGGPEATNNFECDFSGGLIWKGIGFGVTRNMYITQRFYISSGTLRVASNWGSTCC